MVLEIWNDGKVMRRINFRKAKWAKYSDGITEAVIPRKMVLPEGEIKKVSLTRYPEKDELVLSIQTA